MCEEVTEPNEADYAETRAHFRSLGIRRCPTCMGLGTLGRDGPRCELCQGRGRLSVDDEDEPIEPMEAFAMDAESYPVPLPRRSR